MGIQLKEGRDGPSTLACVRADGSRTWGKEHPFFPLHEAVAASLPPADRSRFNPLSEAELASVRALRQALESRWWELAPGTTLEVGFPAEPG
ncbi:MAG: hypothetical protein ACREMI_05010 [Gemmatimonadales bacterium]